jgi:hypothetical protein
MQEDTLPGNCIVKILNTTYKEVFTLYSSSSANQEIPHVLWSLEVLYHIHKSLLIYPILSQISQSTMAYLLSRKPVVIFSFCIYICISQMSLSSQIFQLKFYVYSTTMLCFLYAFPSQVSSSLI